LKNKTDKVIIGILICFCIYLLWVNKTKEITIDEISKLELKLDSISEQKDSVRSVIDSTHIKIITNEKHYQEKFNVIINQSASYDSSFITDYIKQYRSKNNFVNIP
jgi:hypothetical protein